MSLWDAAISIGTSILGSALSGGSSSSSSSSSSGGKRILDTSKYAPKLGSGLEATDRRKADKVTKAETHKSKLEGSGDEEQGEKGADSVALARMWNEVFGNDEDR